MTVIMVKVNPVFLGSLVQRSQCSRICLAAMKRQVNRYASADLFGHEGMSQSSLQCNQKTWRRDNLF